MTMRPQAGTFGTGGPSTGPALFLVIDDEAAGATRTLGRHAGTGYASVAEADGDAVLRLVRAQVIRPVVSELCIPCADGACVVAALKQDGTRLPRLRVLAHARRAAPADDARALAAGCGGELHERGSAEALIREMRWLEGGNPREPKCGPGDDGSGS